jgi:hypothetical protein
MCPTEASLPCRSIALTKLFIFVTDVGILAAARHITVEVVD